MTLAQPQFDDFWNVLDQDLASVPLDLSVERDDFYSQSEWAIYRMRYSSLGGYRLFAWLSVPSGSKGGPIPAVLRMPDYASVHDLIYTPLRHDAVLMNATYRGQRHSDTALQARYPGLLTEGIDRPETYLMRLVFGDLGATLATSSSGRLAGPGRSVIRPCGPDGHRSGCNPSVGRGGPAPGCQRRGGGHPAGLRGHLLRRCGLLAFGSSPSVSAPGRTRAFLAGPSGTPATAAVRRTLWATPTQPVVPPGQEPPSSVPVMGGSGEGRRRIHLAHRT